MLSYPTCMWHFEKSTTGEGSLESCQQENFDVHPVCRRCLRHQTTLHLYFVVTTTTLESEHYRGRFTTELLPPQKQRHRTIGTSIILVIKSLLLSRAYKSSKPQNKRNKSQINAIVSSKARNSSSVLEQRTDFPTMIKVKHNKKRTNMIIWV